MRYYGENGLIRKADQSKEVQLEAQAKEKLMLALYSYKVGYMTGGEKDLKVYLESNAIGIVTGGTEDSATEYIVEVDGYEFGVSKVNLEITSLGAVTGEKPSIMKSEVALSDNKKNATIKVTARAIKGGDLTVKIGNQTATLENGTYNLTVTNNGKYTILVEESELTRKAISTVEVSGIEKVKYTVTVSKGTNIGITKVEPEIVQVEEGNSIEIKATVASGYQFSKWNVISGNESDVESLTSATTTVKPTGDITIEAKGITEKLYLIKEGKDNTEVTGGWEGVPYLSRETGALTFTDNGYADYVGTNYTTCYTKATVNNIDWSGYTKLKMTVEVYNLLTSYNSYGGTYTGIALSKAAHDSKNFLISKSQKPNENEKITITIEIPDTYTDNTFIFIGTHRCYAKIYDVWLEQ